MPSRCSLKFWSKARQISIIVYNFPCRKKETVAIPVNITHSQYTKDGEGEKRPSPLLTNADKQVILKQLPQKGRPV